MTDGLKEKIMEALGQYGYHYREVNDVVYVVEDIAKLVKKDLEENEPQANKTIQEYEVTIETLGHLNFRLD